MKLIFYFLIRLLLVIIISFLIMVVWNNVFSDLIRFTYKETFSLYLLFIIITQGHIKINLKDSKKDVH